MQVMSSMPASSSSHSVSPTARITVSAAARSASSTPGAANRPDMPLPTIAGVFGITRTMRLWPDSQRDSASARMPAAIDTTSAPSSLPASWVQTSRSTCGLTASTTTSSCPNAAGALSSAATP